MKHLLTGVAVAATLALAAPVWAQSPSGGSPNPGDGGAAPAMRAFDFYSKFGVNGNLDSGGTVEEELADMNYIGIYNIREGIPNVAGTSDNASSWFSWDSELSAAGVRQHFHMDAPGYPFGAMSDWLSALKTYIVTPYGANMVTGVSGPNEPNIQYFSYEGLSGLAAANAAQSDLYRGMKADPTLSAIPVDMYPPAWGFSGNFGGTLSQIGNQTAYCDRANLHDYYAADNYTQPTYPVLGNIQVSIQRYLQNIRQVCNRQDFITTETGWYTPTQAGWQGSGANEYVQARLLLNDLFDHAMLPYNHEVYIFDLRWGTVDFSDPGWGVMHDDGTPKISGTAISNLMTILHDPGGNAATFIPGSLGYLLLGMPSTSGNFLIQKSTRAFLLILWNETPIWNNLTATQLTIPTSTVTILLPFGSSGSVYNPLVGTAPIATFTSVNRLQVQLNDSPLIISVQ
jgi:trimeric autotransporter adhesin